jgi:hypothetical protein
VIPNDQEYQTTQQRIAWFQQQLLQSRNTATNSANYRASASGFLAEIDRMQLEVREYLGSLPTEAA